MKYPPKEGLTIKQQTPFLRRGGLYLEGCDKKMSGKIIWTGIGLSGLGLGYFLPDGELWGCSNVICNWMIITTAYRHTKKFDK